MVGTDGNPADLIPVAGAGLKLMVGKEGHGLRQRLLLALVRDGRLHTDDIQALPIWCAAASAQLGSQATGGSNSAFNVQLP